MPGYRPFGRGTLPQLWIRGVEYGDARIRPELAAEERDACISLALVRCSIAAGHVPTDEELLGILIERVCGDDPTREFHGPDAVSRRQPCPCRLSKHSFCRASQASPARQQPRLEAGARGEGHALQKLSPKPRDVDRLHPGPCGQGVNVHKRSGWQPEGDRLTGNSGFLAEKLAELGQVPAEGVQRIVRFGEQQLGEPLAARRRLGHQEVGKQSPRFAPAGWRLCEPSMEDLRLRPQQMDGERSDHD